MVEGLTPPTGRSWPGWPAATPSPPPRCWPPRASRPTRPFRTGRTPFRRGPTFPHQRAGPLRRPGRSPGGDRGGRQSAYESAALLCDHGAERVDAVHRHDTPAFAKVAGRSSTTTSSRRWRPAAGGVTCPPMTRPRSRRGSGRWGGSRSSTGLVPRLDPHVVHRHPRCEVSRWTRPPATPYASPSGRRDARRRPCRPSRRDTGRHGSACRTSPACWSRISVTDGFPDLSEGFETSLPGRVVGFGRPATSAPSTGSPRGPSAARLVVEGRVLLRSVCPADLHGRIATMLALTGQRSSHRRGSRGPPGQRADLGRGTKLRDDQPRDAPARGERPATKPPGRPGRAGAPSSTSGAQQLARAGVVPPGRWSPPRPLRRRSAPGCPGTGRGRRRGFGAAPELEAAKAPQVVPGRRTLSTTGSRGLDRRVLQAQCETGPARPADRLRHRALTDGKAKASTRAWPSRSRGRSSVKAQVAFYVVPHSPSASTRSAAPPASARRSRRCRVPVLPEPVLSRLGTALAAAEAGMCSGADLVARRRGKPPRHRCGVRTTTPTSPSCGGAAYAAGADPRTTWAS